jgi:hypothetical protein
MSGTSINKGRLIRWQHLVFILLIAAVAVGTESCKTTGKLSKKERKAQIENAKAQLTPIINGTSTKSLEQQQKIVNDIAAKNLKDPTLDQMISQAQDVLKKAFADRQMQREKKIDAARAELLDMLLNKDNKSADELSKELAAIKAQNLDDKEINDLIAKVEQKIENMRNKPNIPLKDQLETSFQSIANAGKSGNAAQASSIIKNTLGLFSSDDVPVLIIIFREGSTVDYDKPTTIKRYLNYLMDQKSNPNSVDNYSLDGEGKIKNLELIKK